MVQTNGLKTKIQIMVQINGLQTIIQIIMVHG